MSAASAPSTFIARRPSPERYKADRLSAGPNGSPLIQSQPLCRAHGACTGTGSLGLGVYVAMANGEGGFNKPSMVMKAFGPAAGGWASDDLYPRHLADVNGDGNADIVGFANSGVYVALANDWFI